MKYFIDKDGYKVLNNKQREHRAVMEQHIGRPLLTTEDVHHLDGNRTNNAIGNLVLCPSRSAHLRKFHFTVWNKGQHKTYTFNCAECGKENTKRRGKTAKYCNRTCASKAGLKKALIKNTKYPKYSFCAYQDCDQAPKARGYCKYHYYKEVYPSIKGAYTSGRYLADL